MMNQAKLFNSVKTIKNRLRIHLQMISHLPTYKKIHSTSLVDCTFNDYSDKEGNQFLIHSFKV